MSTAKSIICFSFEHNLPKPTLYGIENDLALVDVVAGLTWRILQICRDLYNLSNRGTLNQGKALHLL